MSTESSESQARPLTYIDADRENFAYQRDHFDALANRDLVARSLATLKARGEYDPARHSDASKYPPLSVDQHLELIARGEVLARHYRHPAHVDNAVKAGATWGQIAAATGSDEARARQSYREWADGQHQLWQHYEGKFGMDDAEHAEAIRLAADSDKEAGQ
jgi:hypothetical protein